MHGRTWQLAEEDDKRQQGKLSDEYIHTGTLAFACIGHVQCKKGNCQTYCGTCAVKQPL
jgi:hypothetical protein